MNKLKINSKPLIWLMGLLLTVFVAGCGSGGNGGGGTGTASVSMTDAPACDGYDQVNVTVSKVRIHQSSSADDKAAGWTDIAVDPQHNKFNLLDLTNGVLVTLGQTTLTAGHYTQLRLVLVPNSNTPNTPLNNSVVVSGNEIALDTPSGIQTGIKLIHQFTVDSGQRVDLLLDFDACNSIVKRGVAPNITYALKPVIKVIPFEQNGIEGFVDMNLIASNVAVSAQQSGNIVRSTVPNTTTGKYFLANLVEQGSSGTFDVVITADDHATTVIAGVLVPTSNSTIAVSTDAVRTPVNAITLVPLSRSISGTVTLDPPTDEPTVFVAAKQTLVGGLTVTVKSLPATLLTVNPGDPLGDYGYNLMLPIDSPWLASGSTTLPLPIVAFTQQPGSVAGKYTVQVSADGYATQSTPSPVDISATNQTQNFALP
jgi:hypothetical protein